MVKVLVLCLLFTYMLMVGGDDFFLAAGAPLLFRLLPRGREAQVQIVRESLLQQEVQKEA